MTNEINENSENSISPERIQEKVIEIAQEESAKKKLNPMIIIDKYYTKGTLLYDRLIVHSSSVMKAAVKIARYVPEANIDFIMEAALLHDVGIFLCDAKKINCEGKEHYMKHGILGKELLEKEGLPKHARVAETHSGFTAEAIRHEGFPLPEVDMLPVTIEEKIIYIADQFFCKEGELSEIRQPRTRSEVESILENHEGTALDFFHNTCEELSLPSDFDTIL